MPKHERNLTVLDLSERDPQSPIVLSHLRGTHDRPVIVKCDRPISVNTFGENPAHAANRIAQLRQENGFYPSVGQIADQAALVLFDCQFVVLSGLKFHKCWPGALDLNGCQNIAILDCKFSACTIAIGANGIDTRDIWIERCKFKQTGKRALWDKIEWDQVHGSYANSNRPVDLKNDKRHYDGDFFRAWNIAGNVTIRDCEIRDAFNAIHFFNSIDSVPEDADRSMARFNNGRRSASNVLIENNTFVRIRDNCIEPEDHAWNWVVRSNTFDDCHAPYSFELTRSGWFYIYNNHHWLENPATTSSRTSGSGFKLSGPHKNEGDFYIFNNSWLLFERGERLFRQQALGRMKHFNNAIRLTSGERRLFGKDWNIPGGLTDDPVKEERRRFTRRWSHFAIEMNGDWICELDGLDVQDYRNAGYALGKETTNRDPGYTKPTRRPGGKKGDRWLKPSSSMQTAGTGWTMFLPGYFEAGKAAKDVREKLQERYVLKVPPKFGVGAGLTPRKLKFFDTKLQFVPAFPVSRAAIIGLTA